MLSSNSIHITFPFCFLFPYDWGWLSFHLLQSFCVCFLWTAFEFFFNCSIGLMVFYNWFVRGLFTLREWAHCHMCWNIFPSWSFVFWLCMLFFSVQKKLLCHHIHQSFWNLGFMYCLEKLSHLQKERNSPIPTFNSSVILFYAFKFLFTWKLHWWNSF